MQLLGRTLIAGEPAGAGGAAFRGVNPADGAALDPPFHETESADVDRAVTTAARAGEAYGAAPAAQRAAFLRAIADELLGLGDELLGRAQAETGLSPARLANERGRTVGQLRMFAELLDEGSWVEARIDPADAARTPPRPDIRRMLVPLGPVAVFAASNFPLAFSVPGGDTASALAAGCTVVCKAHPAHPGTSELEAGAIARAARAARVPAGVFSLLHGWSHEVGLALVAHPAIRAVGFTGSLRAGRALFDAAAARPVPIPVYAEMGSINPVFLLPSAVEQRWQALAQDLAQSITLGVGQFCTNPGVLLGVKGEALDRLTSALAEKIAGSAAGVMLYQRLGESYAASLARARGKGARDVAAAQGGNLRAGPALLAADVAQFIASAELREEMFGPVSIVVGGGSIADLERAAEALEGQLTATIYGTPEELAANSRLIAILQDRAGRLILNGVPTGVEVAHAMHHGGPYPASTDARTTSVGSAAIARFARPVCYQGFPDAALPEALRNHNALGIWRLVNGRLTQADA